MRSPLELLAGKFEHALLTTYSFNLRFFEEWVLRALWASEVRNVVVFVDRHQLGSALMDRAPSAAGRAFHVVSGSCARAAFHPKLLLVTGPEGARLCVSSANLTADGQLRNAESAIAFDSNLSGHRRPILEAGDLFRRLSEEAPPHTAGAIQAALTALPEDEDQESPYRLVHNLDAPLLDAFPARGAIRAVAPFADADGAAARRLHDRGSLTVVVDGEEFAAAPEFFAAPWTVEARKFDARLHGKAYEVEAPEGRWMLVGSPNLSTAALRRTARAGNLEVAVAVAGASALKLPAGKPWTAGDIAAVAAARLSSSPTRAEPLRPSAPDSFDAWENEGRIVVTGVADGSRIERWAEERWHPLGTVSGGAVPIPDPELRPRRLRAVTEGHRVAYAIVSQPALLRVRMRSKARGRQTEAAERLPLDVATVRVLEEALSQLYALSELAGEAPPAVLRPASPDRQGSTAAGQGFAEWMPRDPEEGPRVPPVYLTGWKGEPDALLALVSRVLRLDLQDAPGAEADVGREGVELEDLEQVTSVEGLGVETEEEQQRVSIGAAELRRYQRAFLRLFERGERFLTSSSDPTLAGWAFIYLLRLVEELGSHEVEVDGRPKHLMLRGDLRAIALDVLEKYLAREEPEPLCLATARVHLAAAIRDLARYSRRDAERLRAIAYRWAAELVAVPNDLPAPLQEAVGLDAAGAISRLEDYARRSRWEGALEKAREVLDGAWLAPEPWPAIVGSARYRGRAQSPAWALLGFAAPIGCTTPAPFGVGVRSEGPSDLCIHILICDLGRKRVVEAWQRSADGVWVERHYGAPTAGKVVSLVGPASLEPTMPATELEGLAKAAKEVRALAALLSPAGKPD